MKKSLFLATSIAITAFSGSIAAATIDNFDFPVIEQYNVNGVTPNAGGTTGGVGVIGGSRTTDTNYQSGPLGGNTTVVGGLFTYSSDALSRITSTVTWDAGGAGLGGIDLTEGKADLKLVSFDFNIVSIDQGAIDFTFTVVDTFGQADSITVSGLGAGLASILFSNFTNPLLDFTSVDSISMQITQLSDASDLVLDVLEVNTIPIPAAVWLFGSGLAGLIGFSKRKKNQAILAV